MIAIEFECKCGKRCEVQIHDTLAFSFTPANSAIEQDIRRTESFVIDCESCGEPYEVILTGSMEPIFQEDK